MNKALLIGHLGKTPEIRHLEGGNIVGNFSLATSKKFKDKKSGEVKSATEWHNVVVWGKLAEICEKYLEKGAKVFIEGEIRTRSYEDSEKKKRYVTEIYATNMEMLGGKSEGNGNTSAASEAKVEQQAEVIDESFPPMEDDLPF